MKISRRQMLILMPAAAIAWKAVLAGTPEQSPNYKMSDHWWGMLIDIPKCIGCGNCVRACATENDVPDGYFRTWVERYHVSDERHDQPRGDFAGRRQRRISGRGGRRQEILFCSEDVQPLCGLALHAGLPCWSDICNVRMA